MRNSKQRDVIFKIVENSYDHLDAYGIYVEARKIIPNISLGTIYRNLKILEVNNQIAALEVDGIIHYDKVKKHQHFMCSKCGSITDVYNLEFREPTEVNGNIVTDYNIVLRGVCKKCQKED